MSGAEVAQSKASDAGPEHELSGVKTPQDPGAVADSDKDLLFRPCKLGRYELEHRIVYAPLTRCRAANKGLVPQDNAVEYYSQRARGCERGLIISEATPICQSGHGYPCVPGIYTEEQIDGWRQVVQEVKRHGAIFFMQLWHVGRTSHNEYQPGKAPPLSSTDTAAEGDAYLPDGTCEKFSKPQALDKAGISQVGCSLENVPFSPSNRTTSQEPQASAYEAVSAAEACLCFIPTSQRQANILWQLRFMLHAATDETVDVFGL